MGALKDYVFPDWCFVKECEAPIVHGVPLCEHDQYENPDPER